MFDFGLGSTELLLVAVIALIVIGPKDLPRLLRTMGQYMRKIQGMARDFQNHLNEAAKEAGVDDVKKEVKGMTNFTVTSDLDKQGAEIKKAIESGASQASPNGAKADDANKGKEAPAKADAAKAADKPQVADKAAGKSTTPAKTSGTASSPKAPAKPKTAAKGKSAAKPAAKPKTESKPKPAAKKAGAGPKADPARETAKS
ncbi:MAG: Sec-independent protein translocase protein TatB [bacterium]